MKIIKSYFKDAYYFSFLFSVPEDTVYMAIDENGDLWAYKDEKPFTTDYWWSKDWDFDPTLICSIDLEDIDWKLTLREIE